MRYLKLLFLVSFLSFLVPSQVDIDRATTISQNFFQSRSNDIYTIANIQIISENQDPLLYVFILDPIGFVIVSGNDAAMPILGYSFTDEFREDSLPIQLDWLFEEYNVILYEFTIFPYFYYFLYSH